MDLMVLKTQQFLNNMYGGSSSYEVIEEDGQTGWTTIYALTRALQIELGIINTANSFGPTTISKFKERFPHGINQQENGSTYEDNIYAIIQGALWCKGYSTGASGITKHFYGGTGGAIINLKSDAGLENPNSTVTLEVMQALLSMNQYVTLYSRGGTTKIREIQQYLNRNYIAYVGLAPCDGLYAREMNQAMIKVLQAIEGYSVSEATGYFGSGTKSNLPILPEVLDTEAIYLFRATLCCNGYDVPLSTQWNQTLEDAIEEFQNDMMLPNTKKADTNTWMALMVSRGNTDRPSNGCDTRFEITASRLSILKSNGYEVVGRYLTGGSFKELRIGEADRIIDGGMKLFPIFQESGSDLNYFTEERGIIDANSASNAARKYGMPKGTIIYFAVDTDPMDVDISTRILPYFKGLFENFDPDFKIGVYGTRNVCRQVRAHGYAITSFVSDMSYGFSGNMGFKIPQNWNLDQYYELKREETGWDFDLDKTTYSGRFPVVEYLEHSNYVRPEIPTTSNPSINTLIEDIEVLEDLYISYYNEYLDPTSTTILTGTMITLGVTNYLRRIKYNGITWTLANGAAIDTGFVNYVEEKNLDLHNRILPFIQGEDSDLSDLDIGVIDLAHLMATIEGYIGGGVSPAFWTGWGGDLATGMKATTDRLNIDESVQSTANRTIGNESTKCNYSDFCSDFDAYGIQKKIKTYEWTDAHMLSKALVWYYTSEYNNRFYQIFKELNCPQNNGALREAIYNQMNGFFESFWEIGLLEQLGGKPSDEVNVACCQAFANYIMSMIS